MGSSQVGQVASLLEPTKIIFSQIVQLLIKAFWVVVILFIGWIISKLIKRLVTKVLKVLKFDEVSERLELESALAKGGITYSVSELVGVICYWSALLITFVVAFNAMGLNIAADLLNKVVLYIPNVIAAIFILIAGMFVATLLRNIVQTAANNVGLSQSKLLSKLVEVIIILFAIFIALEQLKIGIRITELTLSIILGSIGLGLAIAFGFGCQDIAKKFLSELIDSLKSKK